MATLEQHAKECEERLGESFWHVHEWLDAYSKLFDPENHGTLHRMFRHNKDGIEYIRKKFGDRAADAAKIHIDRDKGVSFG